MVNESRTFPPSSSRVACRGRHTPDGARFAAMLVLLVVLLAVPAAASALDRFVNPNDTCDPATVGGNPEYDTIQEAVDASVAGDKIHVCPGTYTGSTHVGTPNLTLVAIGHVILTGGVPCLNIIASGVVVHGFEIASCDGGVRLVAGQGLVENNILHDNTVGIIVCGEDNLVRNNLVRDGTDTGISVNCFSPWTVIRNNTLRGNALFDIYMAADGEADHPVTIFKNLVQKSDVGIGVTSSTFCVVSFNSVSFNGTGILLTDIDQCLITRNNVSRSDPGPDCVWDGFGNNTFAANNCRTEVPPGAWD